LYELLAPRAGRNFDLSPDAVPVVTDRARAEAEPELAVLSVMAHGRSDVAQAVRIALAAVAGAELVADRDFSVLYFDLIDAALSDAARKAFQMLPRGYEFQSETLRKNIATTRIADILDVLDARGLAVSSEQRERILGCTDLEMLKHWHRTAVTAASTDALFD